jgi:hypothetical protein
MGGVGTLEFDGGGMKGHGMAFFLCAVVVTTGVGLVWVV